MRKKNIYRLYDCRLIEDLKFVAKLCCQNFDKNNMAELGNEFSFYQDIHLTNGGIFTSIRPMTTEIAQAAHLEKSTRLRLIKKLLVMSSL